MNQTFAGLVGIGDNRVSPDRNQLIVEFYRKKDNDSLLQRLLDMIDILYSFHLFNIWNHVTFVCHAPDSALA